MIWEYEVEYGLPLLRTAGLLAIPVSERADDGEYRGFCQIPDHGPLQARDAVVARPPPDSARAVSLPQMAPDFPSLSDVLTEPRLLLTGDSALYESYVSRRLRVVLDHAGLPRVTFYQFRHTAATLMLTLDVPLEQVQELLRRADISTIRRYAQIVESLRRDAMAEMDRLLRESAHDSTGGTEGGTNSESWHRKSG